MIMKREVENLKREMAQAKKMAQIQKNQSELSVRKLTEELEKVRQERDGYKRRLEVRSERL